MNVFQLTMNAQNTQNNISRIITPEVYRKRESARVKLGEIVAMHLEKEGYVLRKQTPDIAVFNVRAIPEDYTLTMAIETLVLI